MESSVTHDLEQLLENLDLDDYQSEPSRLLDIILERLSEPRTPHGARYGELVAINRDKLRERLFKSLRQEVSDLFICETYPPLNRVSRLGGNLKSHGRGIYMHIVRLPSQTYYYIGQAYNLSFRINSQHQNFRYRRDNPSLHYYAVDRSVSDSFVILATLTNTMERQDLVLNMLEMWCCLLFRSLPDSSLRNWLGEDAVSVDQVPSLNVALPLDNKDDEASRAAFELLKYSGDTLAQAYYADVRRGSLRPRPYQKPVKEVEAQVAPRGGSDEAAVSPQRGMAALFLDVLRTLRSEFVFGAVFGATSILGLYWIRRLAGRFVRAKQS